MSRADPMERGTHPIIEEALGRVAQRLDLPQPDRTRILEEIALDLGDILEGLVERGHSRNEAAERAVRLLAPSEASIDALIGLHEPLYRRLARRFSPEGMRRAERVLLLVMAAVGLVPPLAALLGSGLLTRPSPLLLPILAAAVLILLLSGHKSIRLLVEKDHSPETLKSWLGWLLALSGASLVLGAMGVAFEAYALAAAVERTGTADATLIVPWLIDTAVLVAAALLTTLVGGLCWFLLLQKAEAVEQAHRRISHFVRTPPPLDGKGALS